MMIQSHRLAYTAASRLVSGASTPMAAPQFGAGPASGDEKPGFLGKLGYMMGRYQHSKAIDAQLGKLLDQLNTHVDNGEIEILEHRAQADWHKDIQRTPFGPNKIRIAGRPYILERHKLIPYRTSDFRLRSEDGRIQLTYADYKLWYRDTARQKSLFSDYNQVQSRAGELAQKLMKQVEAVHLAQQKQLEEAASRSPRARKLVI